ncbi:MAG: hypothetical protein ACKO9Q_25345, partial [Pirellula sp.]
SRKEEKILLEFGLTQFIPGQSEPQTGTLTNPGLSKKFRDFPMHNPHSPPTQSNELVCDD